jgi:hypothetical protein
MKFNVGDVIDSRFTVAQEPMGVIGGATRAGNIVKEAKAGQFMKTILMSILTKSLNKI